MYIHYVNYMALEILSNPVNSVVLVLVSIIADVDVFRMGTMKTNFTGTCNFSMGTCRTTAQKNREKQPNVGSCNILN